MVIEVECVEVGDCSVSLMLEDVERQMLKVGDMCVRL